MTRIVQGGFLAFALRFPLMLKSLNNSSGMRRTDQSVTIEIFEFLSLSFMIFAKILTNKFDQGITRARWGVSKCNISHCTAHFKEIKSTPIIFCSTPHPFRDMEPSFGPTVTIFGKKNEHKKDDGYESLCPRLYEKFYRAKFWSTKHPGKH